MWKVKSQAEMPSALESQSSKRGERLVGAGGAAHFDERGGAADEGGPAAGVVGVLRERAHEGQVDVDVRVDEAGEDVLADRVDDFGAGRRGQVAADGGDRFAFAEDVGDVLVGGGGDLAVFDQQGHENLTRTEAEIAGTPSICYTVAIGGEPLGET